MHFDGNHSLLWPLVGFRENLLERLNLVESVTVHAPCAGVARGHLYSYVIARATLSAVCS